MLKLLSYFRISRWFAVWFHCLYINFYLKFANVSLNLINITIFSMKKKKKPHLHSLFATFLSTALSLTFLLAHLDLSSSIMHFSSWPPCVVALIWACGVLVVTLWLLSLGSLTHCSNGVFSYCCKLFSGCKWGHHYRVWFGKVWVAVYGLSDSALGVGFVSERVGFVSELQWVWYNDGRGWLIWASGCH